jgi:hypothetical protein
MSHQLAYPVKRTKPNKGDSSSKFPAFMCFRSSEVVFECHIRKLCERHGTMYYSFRVVVVDDTDTELQDLTLDFKETELIKMLQILDGLRDQ